MNRKTHQIGIFSRHFKKGKIYGQLEKLTTIIYSPYRVLHAKLCPVSGQPVFSVFSLVNRFVDKPGRVFQCYLVPNYLFCQKFFPAKYRKRKFFYNIRFHETVFIAFNFIFQPNFQVVRIEKFLAVRSRKSGTDKFSFKRTS